MQKRAISPLSGRRRPDRGLLGDQRGITPVVGAIFVLAFVVMALSIYLGQVVPAYLRYNEAEHMDTVRGAFIDLQGLIFSRENGTIDLPMSAEPTPIFSLPPTASRVEVTQAKWVKRFQPVDDAYVQDGGPEDGNPHDNEVLWIGSYQSGGTPYNRRIFTKFDLATELPGISKPNIAEAWLVLYCENITKFMERPFNNPDYDPYDTTVVNQFYLPDLPIKVEIREVENGTWEEAEITWNNQPTYGDTIKAGDWPWDDNHTVKDNEAWFTWDVTSWVRDRLDTEGEDNVSFLLKPIHENSTLERYATFSAKERTATAINVLDENESLAYMAGGHPPYFMPHLTVIYDNGDQPGPPVYDNWGAFVEGGSVRFDAQYREFPEHSFILEDGALFQQQYGFAYEFIISDPGLVVGERLDSDVYGDNIAIYLNRYRIVNWDRLTSTADAKLIVSVQENFDDYDDTWTITSDGPMRQVENLLITIRSDFEWPWKYYSRDSTYRWNSSASKGGLEWWVDYYPPDENGDSTWSGNVVEFIAKLYIDRNIRLYFWGQVEDPEVQDIFFYDRTYDVEVQVGV